ncbi:MAG: PRC-barrel domain-containing protein [Candidatus Promineifilaceae bacterium]
MQTIIQNIHGYTVQATDGDVGKVDTLYVDDETWAIRYLVINVGNWFMTDKILLSPMAVTEVNTDDETISVALTKEQVKESPDVDTEKPVSRQYETTLHDYYNWRPYWLDAPTYAGGLTAVRTPTTLNYKPRPENRMVTPADDADPYLRSTREMVGYHIHATDGEIGHIETFLVDTDLWFVRYFVVDTRNWLPGKKVIVAPNWINTIHWADNDVTVGLAKEAIKSSPEFEGPIAINRDYEQRLYDHYHRSVYWQEMEPTR